MTVDRKETEITTPVEFFAIQPKPVTNFLDSSDPDLSQLSSQSSPNKSASYYSEPIFTITKSPSHNDNVAPKLDSEFFYAGACFSGNQVSKKTRDEIMSERLAERRRRFREAPSHRDTLLEVESLLNRANRFNESRSSLSRMGAMRGLRAADRLNRFNEALSRISREERRTESPLQTMMRGSEIIRTLDRMEDREDNSSELDNIYASIQRVENTNQVHSQSDSSEEPDNDDMVTIETPISVIVDGINSQADKKKNSKKVTVEFHTVDEANSEVTGEITIYNITKDLKEVKTFFVGQIIGNNLKHRFQTRAWDAEITTDLNYWTKFKEFPSDWKESFYKEDFDGDIDSLPVIFMRWKELFFINENQRVSEVFGQTPSFHGFYYVCMNKFTGEIKGFYFSRECETQELALNHVSERDYSVCPPVFSFMS